MIVDRVRSMTAQDLENGEMLFRLTQLEEPSINTAAEGEEVVDAVGSLITTVYRAKTATFSASNSLLSLDLAAAQYGTKKDVASADKKIVVPTYEVVEFTAADSAGKQLKHVPVKPEEVKYAYEMQQGGIGKSFRAGSQVSATEFKLDGQTLTPPTDFVGKLFIEYNYESENAVALKNRSSKFPTAFSAVIYVYFRDVCTDKLISGKIICPKAKINPESIELGMTATGKHPFEMKMMKDFCADETADELFSIVVSNDDEE